MFWYSNTHDLNQCFIKACVKSTPMGCPIMINLVNELLFGCSNEFSSVMSFLTDHENVRTSESLLICSFAIGPIINFIWILRQNNYPIIQYMSPHYLFFCHYTGYIVLYIFTKNMWFVTKSKFRNSSSVNTFIFLSRWLGDSAHVIVTNLNTKLYQGYGRGCGV